MVASLKMGGNHSFHVGDSIPFLNLLTLGEGYSFNLIFYSDGKGQLVAF